MFNGLLSSHQTKTITSAAVILAVSTLISRILGILRYFLLAKTFGASSELDIYFAAFRIPDFIYNILIAGGVIVVFIPLFSEYFSKDTDSAWKFVSNVLNIFLFSLIFLSVLLLIFAFPIMKLITPGFSPEQLEKAVLLTRLMLLSPILLGLSAIFSGVLQYFNRFLIYSFAPVLYNVGIIFGIVLLSSEFGILGVVSGVILGAILHLMIQLPAAISCGFKYQFIFNLKDPGIKRVFLLMLPRTFATAGFQINSIVATAIASTLTAGSISIFNFSSNLQSFPVGIIGASFAIAAFPSLARNFVDGIKNEFIKNFSQTFRQVLYFITPLTFLLFILRDKIVEAVYQHGQFTQVPAHLTAVSLGLFCVSIFGFSLTPLLSRAFFSFQDTKTPTFIALAMVSFNIALNYFFVNLIKTGNSLNGFLSNAFSVPETGDIAVWGLPLASSVSAVLYLTFLMIFLYRKIGDFNLKEIFNSFLRIFISSILMAIGVYFAIKMIPAGVVAQLFIAAFVALIIYFAATFLFKSPETKVILRKIGLKK